MFHQAGAYPGKLSYSIKYTLKDDSQDPSPLDGSPDVIIKVSVVLFQRFLNKNSISSSIFSIYWPPLWIIVLQLTILYFCFQGDKYTIQSKEIAERQNNVSIDIEIPFNQVIHFQIKKMHSLSLTNTQLPYPPLESVGYQFLECKKFSFNKFRIEIFIFFQEILVTRRWFRGHTRTNAHHFIQIEKHSN